MFKCCLTRLRTLSSVLSSRVRSLLAYAPKKTTSRRSVPCGLVWLPFRAEQWRQISLPTIAVCRIATGFFVVGDHRNGPKRSHGDRNSRRTSVNNVLCLVREQYFCADLTLGGLAKHLGLSGAYLSRALAAETGHPFRTHLNGIRMLAAVARLSCGLAPLSAIAAQVGYPRTGELDRQFHRWFWLSPRQFRTFLGALPPDRLLGPAIEPARPL